MKKFLLPAVFAAMLSTCASAQVLDPMDSLANWSVFGDSTTHGVWGLAPGGGIGANYVLNQGSWVVVSKDCTSESFLQGDCIRFLYKGDGTTNDLHVQLIDRDGTVSLAVLPHALSHTGWTEETLNLPITSDGDFPNAGYIATSTVLGSGLPFYPEGAADQQSLDRQRILAIGFVESSVTFNSGFFTIDNVRLMKHGPQLIYVEDFDGVAGTNKFCDHIMVGTTPVSVDGAFGSTMTYTNGHWIGGYCNAVRISTVTVVGMDGMGLGNVLELDYDVSDTSSSNDYAGFYINLNNTDISQTKYLSFKVRGAVGNEKFNIKLRPGAGNVTNTLPITKYVTAVTSNWQDVHNIPLSDFGNLITTGSLSGGTTTTNCDQLVFEFNGSLNAPYTGTVYIDDVKFIASQDIDASTVQTIDSMDDSPNSLSPWQRYGDYTDALTSVPGASGVLGDNAICFTYAYIPGDPSNNYGWAALQRYLKPDFAQANSFSFQYMGAGGPDDVELNVIDMNGVSYCRKFYGASNTGGQWVTATTPINQLSLLVSSATANGPLTKLDLRNISRVELGVSRGLASSGSGGIAFKDIEYASDPAQIATGSSVLDSLEIPDNPFSPNGDGVKDKGRFIFKLKQNARVKLEIYALKGERVRLMDQGEITDGNVHVIEWDGSDDNGVRVNNGLYLYRFYADNMFGQTDKAINVIGVIR